MKRDKPEIRGIIAVVVTVAISIVVAYNSKPNQEPRSKAAGYWVPIHGTLELNQTIGEANGK